MNSSIRKLPDGELEVMQAVWAAPNPCNRSEIRFGLTLSRDIAETTLLTMLSRLAEKGFLEIHKSGRSSVYAPLIAREDYLASQSNRFFKKLCGGSISTLASALCSSGLTKAELDELRRLLEEDAL